MPVNKDALRRYRVIDKALSDPNRDYTTDDILTLVNRECNKVSLRMIQKDIKAIEEEFGKRIVRNAGRRGTVRYEDQSTPLFYQELTLEEAEMLKEVLHSLGHFDGLDDFIWLDLLRKRLNLSVTYLLWLSVRTNACRYRQPCWHACLPPLSVSKSSD